MVPTPSSTNLALFVSALSRIHGAAMVNSRYSKVTCYPLNIETYMTDTYNNPTRPGLGANMNKSCHVECFVVPRLPPEHTTELAALAMFLSEITILTVKSTRNANQRNKAQSKL